MAQLNRTFVSTNNAAKPLGPYNQAIIADRTVYVSGCLGLDKDTLTLVPGGAAAEMKKALENMVGILCGNGREDNDIRCRFKDFGAINEEYKKVSPKISQPVLAYK